MVPTIAAGKCNVTAARSRSSWKSRWPAFWAYRVRVTASGRTDAGVHALGQVASFDADTSMAAEQLFRAMNGRLPPDIRVLQVEDATADGFHAINAAQAKTYRYQFWDARQHDVFRRTTHWHVRTRLDDALMHQAGSVC